MTCLTTSLIIFLIIIFSLIPEKGERERNIDMRQKHQLPLTRTLTGDETCNWGMCPDREQNPPPFGLRDNVQPNEAYQPGQKETAMWETGCLPYVTWLGIKPEPRHMPWVGIEPTTVLVSGMMFQPSLKFLKAKHSWHTVSQLQHMIKLPLKYQLPHVLSMRRCINNSLSLLPHLKYENDILDS